MPTVQNYPFVPAAAFSFRSGRVEKVGIRYRWWDGRKGIRKDSKTDQIDRLSIDNE